MPTLATDYLVPSPEFLVPALIYLGLFVVSPLVSALRARRYVWAVAIVLFAPFAGVLWWIVGRRTHARQRSLRA